MADDLGGRLFRKAWIDGVLAHYPGTPKEGYIVSWDAMPDWERESASAVYEQIRHFVAITDGKAASLTRSQRGQFVCLCWLGQVYKHIPEPKSAYVAEWDHLPEWQRATNSDIFDAVEAASIIASDR